MNIGYPNNFSLMVIQDTCQIMKIGIFDTNHMESDEPSNWVHSQNHGVQQTIAPKHEMLTIYFSDSRFREKIPACDEMVRGITWIKTPLGDLLKKSFR